MNAEPVSIFSRTTFSRRMSAAISRGDALPWTLIGAALAAMAALYFSSDRFVGLPVLAALLIFSRSTSWRLPRSIVITYGLRAVILIVLLTLINRTDIQDSTVWYLKQEDTNFAGYALAADIVLRAWERRDATGAREGLGVVVLMSALLFAAATNTYERLHIQLITPIYAILLLLALRSFALMNQPAQSTRELRRSLVLFRSIIIFLTLGFAFAAVFAVTRYEYQVTNWAMKYVGQHHGDQHDIGYSATPQLSRIFNPEPSTSRVLIIDGLISDAHLRVATFDLYQRSQWLPAISDRDFAPMEAVASDPSDTIRTTFTRLADTADLLAVPLGARSLHSQDPLEQDQFQTIRDSRAGSFEPYDLFDAPQGLGSHSLATIQKLDEKLRQRSLAIPPEIDPKVLDLAKRVAGEGKTERQLFRIQEYLRSHHAYSLEFDPHGEPLNDFILNDRAAHCQYFASAMVVMARAVGVPARYVGGFYAHERYGNNQIVVRQRDAHAWAECWLEPVGWVTFDATPTGGRPDGIFRDPSAWKRWWEKLSDVPGAIRGWFSNHAAMLTVLASAGLFVSFIIWLVRLILSWSKRGPAVTPRYAGPTEELLQIGRRYERWLSKRGSACPPPLTWRAQLAGSGTMGSNSQETALRDRFLRTYDRARFGLDQGGAIEEAQALVTQLEQRV